MGLGIRGSSTLTDGCTMEDTSSTRTGAANTGTACLIDTGGAMCKDCGEGRGGAENTGIIFRIVTGGAILLCGLQCPTGI